MTLILLRIQILKITTWNVFGSKIWISNLGLKLIWREFTYHISLISKLGVPLGSHNTEPNWWNYTQRNCFWFAQFRSRKWMFKVRFLNGLGFLNGRSLNLKRSDFQKWNPLFYLVHNFEQSTLCYNLGKLIKRNTYGFYLYLGNCLGEMKCNLLFFHINFNHKNTKAQMIFFLTQWLLIPVRLWSRK